MGIEAGSPRIGNAWSEGKWMTMLPRIQTGHCPIFKFSTCFRCATSDNCFEIKHYKQYTVRTNNHIKLTEDNHYYCVPFQYIGKKAKVIYTKNLVRIYCEGKQVAVHPRQSGQGTYTSQSDHLCSQHQHYLKRSPDYYLKQARSRSQQMHQLFKRIFDQNKHPEQLYGTCDGILNLYKKADQTKVNRACQIALDNHNYSYKFILNIIQNNILDPADSV